MMSVDRVHRFILTICCENRPGLVADIGQSVFEVGGDIIELHQFDDEDRQKFFCRLVFDCDAQAETIEPELRDSLGARGLSWQRQPEEGRLRVVVLLSKQDHCLNELLYQQHTGSLKINIVAIASNHPYEALSIPQIGDIPFFYLPVTAETKKVQEARIKKLCRDAEADLVILARYMQILSDDLVAFLEGRCINIHHSFLPGFKGAKPYHQAYARGVKMIGATAHYVTADLDEGPIIAQDVESLSHADLSHDLVRKGREIERRVLTRAVQSHADYRVFKNGCRTVVFQR